MPSVTLNAPKTPSDQKTSATAPAMARREYPVDGAFEKKTFKAIHGSKSC